MCSISYGGRRRDEISVVSSSSSAAGAAAAAPSPSAEAEIVEARMGRLMLEAAAADDAAAVGREAAANASQGLIPAARSEIVSRRHRVMMFEMMVSTLLTNYGT